MFRTPLVLQADKQPDVWIVREPLVWSTAPVLCALPVACEKCARECVVVPAGTLTDLASVPVLVQNLPFLDPTGRSRSPSVLHDFLYRGGTFVNGRRPTRGEADRLLRVALRSERSSRTVAAVFWLGVRAGGWFAWQKR